jgi:hypothetical protein
MADEILVLDLSDVTGFRLECPRCHSSLLFRADQQGPLQIPEACPSPACRTDWDSDRESVQRTVLMLDTIRRWNERKAPFILRFEIGSANATKG